MHGVGEILNIRYEFRLFLQFLPETFFILRTNERVIVINSYYNSYEVPVTFVRF
jgi:hypothetical protein